MIVIAREAIGPWYRNGMMQPAHHNVRAYGYACAVIDIQGVTIVLHIGEYGNCVEPAYIVVKSIPA